MKNIKFEIDELLNEATKYMDSSDKNPYVNPYDQHLKDLSHDLSTPDKVDAFKKMSNLRQQHEDNFGQVRYDRSVTRLKTDTKSDETDPNIHLQKMIDDEYTPIDRSIRNLDYGNIQPKFSANNYDTAFDAFKDKTGKINLMGDDGKINPAKVEAYNHFQKLKNNPDNIPGLNAWNKRQGEAFGIQSPSENHLIRGGKVDAFKKMSILRQQHKDNFTLNRDTGSIQNTNTPDISHAFSKGKQATEGNGLMDMIHNPYAQMAAAAGVGLAGYGAHKYFKNKKGNN